MSMYSSYASTLGEGNMFSAKTRDFNEAVDAHNRQLDLTYKQTLLTQKGTIASDKQKEVLTGTKDGVQDGAGLLGTLVGAAETAKGISSQGTAAYLATTKAARSNAIGSTWQKLKAGTPIEKTSAPASVTSDGKVTEATTSETTKPMTQPKSTGASDPEPEPEPEQLTETEDLRTSGVIGDGGEFDPAKAAAPVVEDAAAPVKAVTAVAPAAEEEIGSSGLVPKLIKGTLVKLGGKAVASDAALSAASEVGGKAISAFAGVTDGLKGIDNLAEGRNFFGNDDTAHKWGDSFQIAGSVADLAGTAFPPLEVLGGALSLTGGLIDGIDDMFTDSKNTQTDSTNIPPPKKTAVKVSPAYAAMGLIASAPISAKTSIQGSGSF